MATPANVITCKVFQMMLDGVDSPSHDFRDTFEKLSFDVRFGVDSSAASVHLNAFVMAVSRSELMKEFAASVLACCCLNKLMSGVDLGNPVASDHDDALVVFRYASLAIHAFTGALKPFSSAEASGGTFSTVLTNVVSIVPILVRRARSAVDIVGTSHDSTVMENFGPLINKLFNRLREIADRLSRHRITSTVDTTLACDALPEPVIWKDAFAAVICELCRHEKLSTLNHQRVVEYTRETSENPSIRRDLRIKLLYQMGLRLLEDNPSDAQSMLVRAFELCPVVSTNRQTIWNALVVAKLLLDEVPTVTTGSDEDAELSHMGIVSLPPQLEDFVAALRSGHIKLFEEALDVHAKELQRAQLLKPLQSLRQHIVLARVMKTYLRSCIVDPTELPLSALQSSFAGHVSEPQAVGLTVVLPLLACRDINGYYAAETGTIKLSGALPFRRFPDMANWRAQAAAHAAS